MGDGNISKGKWKTNKINESVHSLTFGSNLAEEVNRIIEDVDAFKSSDTPEDIIAKKAFDPFDEAIGDDDEEIQYLKRCIQKCNSKKLTRTDGRIGNSLGDLRNVIINISGAEFRTKWKHLKNTQSLDLEK